jgi:hypothetical protein
VFGTAAGCEPHRIFRTRRSGASPKERTRMDRAIQRSSCGSSVDWQGRSLAARTAWDHERRKLLHMHQDLVVCNQVSPSPNAINSAAHVQNVCCHPVQLASSHIDDYQGVQVSSTQVACRAAVAVLVGRCSVRVRESEVRCTDQTVFVSSRTQWVLQETVDSCWASVPSGLTSSRTGQRATP